MTERAVPARVFGFSAVAAFIVGVVGMFDAAHSDDMKLLAVFFSLAFFLAPALLVYPLIRLLVGEGKAVLAALLSALFGGYVQSSIKRKLDK